MSQARHADWAAANDRARRLCADAFVTFEESQRVDGRWAVWERFDMATGAGRTDDEILAAPTKEVDALYCRAPTAEEALLKYAFMKQEQRNGKVPPVVVFRDRANAGFGNKEPDEPTEWKAYRARWAAHRQQQIAVGAEHPRASAERTQEQVRATVRNFMALRGGLNPRDMGRDLKRALGIGRLGNDWLKR